MSQPSGLRDRIAEALASARWGGDSDRDSHAMHNYLYTCAICRADLPAIADAALEIVQADLDAKDREVERVHTMMDGMDEALLAARTQRDKAEADLTEILSLLAASHADAHAAEADRDRLRNLAVEILDHHTPIGHTDHPHSMVTRWRTALDQHTTHTCPRCGLATYGGTENLCPPCDLALADEVAAEYLAERDRLRAAVERVREMADAWEQRLPALILTAVAVEAIRAAVELAALDQAPATEQAQGGLNREPDVQASEPEAEPAIGSSYATGGVVPGPPATGDAINAQLTGCYYEAVPPAEETSGT